MLILRWFLYRKVRHGVDACRQVRKLVRSQADLLAAQAIDAVLANVTATRTILATGTFKEIDTALEQLEQTAQQYLRPYPHPRWRENLEVFLVTSAVVLALRTFFFQPMAIPSGSAQPTLYGITADNLRDRPDVVIPTGLQRFVDKWWRGISYFHVVAKEDGVVNRIDNPRLVFAFLRRQSFQVGRHSYAVYFPSSFEDLCRNRNLPGLAIGMSFKAGEDILKMRVTSGDHLFVNRLIYNFRPPKRGEIIVFSTQGLHRQQLTADTHYIKRLVGLGGERVRIGNDRHLYINDQRLDASTPGFENVYAFDPTFPPKKDQYSGHVNAVVGQSNGIPWIAPLFENESATFVVKPHHYLPMGDNTMNSSDGRVWGAIPEDKIIGRASFVFWPITSRFGWGYN